MQLAIGQVQLDARQSRHLRDVLRIGVGEAVELFDDAGRRAQARVLSTADVVVLKVEAVQEARSPAIELVMAAAVPKGPRADWMVEKLSELGVACYIPLETDRGIVHPEAGKLQRWGRIAEESAKQCKRNGVMRIEAPMTLQAVCAASQWAKSARWCMTTGERSLPIAELLPQLGGTGTLLALIGPEGGWTEGESELMQDAHFQLVGLTRTILRIETAALALAAVVMTKGRSAGATD